MQTLFVSHGGGPLPLLEHEPHQALVEGVCALKGKIRGAPKVLVVISAHWEAPGFFINTAAQPELIYDYHGFDPAAYTIKYPAPGAPDLAESLIKQLTHYGVHTNAMTRGWDHGVFVPLTLLYPEATTPVLQISLSARMDPEHHWRLGQALRQVLPEGALLVGSGFTFHNMPLFFQSPSSKDQKATGEFHCWLDDMVCSNTHSHLERERAWLNWSAAPGARLCHPREEHLLPLLVCAAAAGKAAEKIAFNVMGVEARHYYWR